MDELQNENKETIEEVNGAENADVKTETQETESIDAEKSARFQEESKDRMYKICQQIGYLEKIAGKHSVDYSQKDVEKMFAYLEKQLNDCKGTFMKRFEESKKFDFDF
ncbi:MAG: hypothetical protein NC489_27770 [Ruminococcus flavefaciens]|nr:hypothetical protein [Ruminococcus flavefaciens]